MSLTRLFWSFCREDTTEDEGKDGILAGKQNGTVHPEANTDAFVMRLALVASMSGLLFGYDTGVVSGAIVFIENEMNLDNMEVQIVVSSTILAAAISACFGHDLLDPWGRKKTLMFSSAIFVIGSLIMGAAVGPRDGYFALVLGRAVVGVAIGLASEAGPLYISECAPPRFRGKLTTLFNVAVVGGQVCSAILCGLLSYLPPSYNWRLMLGFGVVPALAQAYGFSSLPLSPAWLVLRGRKEEAEAVLRRIRIPEQLLLGGAELDEPSAPDLSPSSSPPRQRDAPGEHADSQRLRERMIQEEAEERLQKELKEIIEEAEEAKRHKHVSIWKLWASDPKVRRAMVLGCSLWAASQLAGINTIMYYGASIISRTGVNESSSSDIWLTVPLYTMQLMGILVCYGIIDQWGRRPTLLVSMVNVCLSLCLIGIGFVAQNGLLTIVAMFAYLFSFGVGLSTMPYTMNAEIYPTEYRGVCIAQATAVFWFTNFIVSVSFLTLSQRLGNTGGAFFVYAFIVLVSGCYFYAVVPETSGLSLHQIQNVFESELVPTCYHNAAHHLNEDGAKSGDSKSYGTTSSSPIKKAIEGDPDDPSEKHEFC